MIRQPKDKLDVARAALELVCEPVFIFDARRDRIVDVNRAGCEALGLKRREVIDRGWQETLPLLGEVTLSPFDEHRTIAVAHGACERTAGSLTGRHDALTGLAGRDALAVREAATRQAEGAAPRGLLFIDLDDFKRINDGWGHTAGDHVLRVTAQRLSESVRRRDLVVRYGGDEFLVLIDEPHPRRDLKRLARRIRRAVRRPIHFHDDTMIVSASIGIAQSTSCRDSIESLIAEADRWMYRAKFSRRSAKLGHSTAKGEQSSSGVRLAPPPHATFGSRRP